MNLRSLPHSLPDLMPSNDVHKPLWLRTVKSLVLLSAMARGAVAPSAHAAPQLNVESVPTVGALGNSISRNQYSPREWGGLVGTNRVWTPFGAFVFFACDGIAIPELYSFEGYSGKTSWEIAKQAQPKSATETWGVDQKIPIGLAALTPNITVIIASTNDLLLAPPADVVSGQALEKALEGLRENIRYVQSIGSIPVVCNILPIEGLTPLVPGASIPNDLTSEVPAWNAAIEELCKSEDVWYCDIFSACARDDGSSRWKDGFVYQRGAEVEGGQENSWKVHPSQLASLAIAREALGPLLRKVISPACPPVPVEVGNANLAPAMESWKLDYDPQSDSSFEIEPSGNQEVLHFSKPSHADSRYAQWTSGEIEVTPGQTFLYTAKLRFQTCDNLASLGFSIADRTPDSKSRGQPLIGIGLSEKTTPQGLDTRTFQGSGVFTIPPGVSRICASVSINRTAGGSEGMKDQVTLSDLVLTPLSPQQAAKHQPAP